MSVLLLGETGVGGKIPSTCGQSQTNYDIMLYRLHSSSEELELTTLVMIGIYCTSSCKSNYHTITTVLKLF